MKNVLQRIKAYLLFFHLKLDIHYSYGISLFPMRCSRQWQGSPSVLGKYMVRYINNDPIYTYTVYTRKYIYALIWFPAYNAELITRVVF